MSESEQLIIRAGTSAAGRPLISMIVQGQQEIFFCSTEDEVEARTARCSAAVHQMVGVMGLRATRIDEPDFVTDTPSWEQFTLIVEMCRLHLSGAV